MKPYLLKYPELENLIEVRSATISRKDLLGEQAKLMSKLQVSEFLQILNRTSRREESLIYVVDQDALTHAAHKGLVSLSANIDIVPVSILSRPL